MPAVWLWGMVPKTKKATQATVMAHCMMDAQANAAGRRVTQPKSQKASERGANTSGAKRMLKLSGCSNYLNL